MKRSILIDARNFEKAKQHTLSMSEALSQEKCLRRFVLVINHPRRIGSDMSERFEIDEVAIYWNLGYLAHGDECTVTAGLSARSIIDTAVDKRVVAECYYIQFSTGEARPALPRELRKKPKRRECDKLVSWEDMPWRPIQMRDIEEVWKVLQRRC
jgi:hypothetical protein